jgi:hypothetical protein
MLSKIVVDQGGMLGRIIIDDRSIVAAFKMRVRFNRRVEVLDPNGSVQTTIDIANRTGALAPLWKLTEVTDVAKVEMDETAFRIRLSDGSVIRSQNILDVRQPDVAQVEFWTPATAYDDAEPAPDAIKRYPAILAAQ